MSSLPDRLLAARRCIDAFPELRLVHDLTEVGDGLWSFAVDVSVGVLPGSLLPNTTRWRIVVADSYPVGQLDAFPDAEDGITLTFPHQYCNRPPGPKTPLWRKGIICVRSPSFMFKRRHLDSEPAGSPERMRWFLGRVIAWMRAAAEETLLADGDPFELPDFAPEGLTVAWSESKENLCTWLTEMPQFGLADIYHICGSEEDGVFAVQVFRDARAKELMRVPWGDLVTEKRLLRKAVWMKLPHTPSLEPYQAPLTWGDMRECFGQMKLSFNRILQRALYPIRDDLPHLALFGFPIPEKVGGDTAVMHWQACMLPPLAHGDNTRNGFRNTANGYWRQDCFDEFRRANEITWCHSRNWHMDQLTGRGSLNEVMRRTKVGIIGAGAVGSVLAELLVRAGLLSLEVVDNDKIAAGNLVRHTLTLDNVGQNKAEALAARLRTASPHVAIIASDAAFPDMSETKRNRLTSCDLLIDCSADDDVARALGTSPWNGANLRVSVSLGFGAKRCYIYVAPAPLFSLADLQAKASDWFVVDKKELASADLPAEAIGCWHPLFPARIDDVWSMTSLAVREIERFMQEPPTVSMLIVYEKNEDDGDDVAVVRRVV